MTGFNSLTGAPFGPSSDIDFFAESNQLAKSLVSTSKNIPGLVYPSAISKAHPGVADWASKWSAVLGCEVSVAGFPTGGIPTGPVIYGPP
ncbi:MAG: hypothetical protein U1E28_02040 [Beijerinckiaceae bacterium]